MAFQRTLGKERSLSAGWHGFETGGGGWTDDGLVSALSAVICAIMNPLQFVKGQAKAALGIDRRRFLDYVETWVVPRHLPPGPDLSNVPEGYFGHAGIELNVDAQLALLKRLAAHREVFNRLRADVNLNSLGTPERIANGMFHTPDAEVYAGMILEFSPRRVVEIGSGFSTRVARLALDAAGSKGPLASVDPQPRAEIRGLVDEHIAAYIEDVEIEKLAIEPGTLLFIDTSHICRARGDLPRLFCQLIPTLPAGVLIHVHDIFIPFEYPTSYQRALWNEQYLLHALLSHSPRYEVVLTTHFLSRRHAAEIQKAISPEVGRDKDSFGGSFWFRTKGVS
jgi:hypothetical protein